MEAKHLILKYHLDELRDHVNDGWRNYEEAKTLKEYDEQEEARNFLTEARKRTDSADKEVDNISMLSKKYDLNLCDNILISLYDDILYRLDQLKEKVERMKF